jgi:hypothetical protein
LRFTAGCRQIGSAWGVLAVAAGLCPRTRLNHANRECQDGRARHRDNDCIASSLAASSPRIEKSLAQVHQSISWDLS